MNKELKIIFLSTALCISVFLHTLSMAANFQSVNIDKQLPSYSGVVQQYILNTKGEIDGLLLKEGMEIITPSELSTVLAYSIHPNDRIIVYGIKEADIPLIEALLIANQTNGKEVVIDIQNKKKKVNYLKVEDEVRMVLHGSRGEVEGAILNDGTIIRLLPAQFHQFGELIHQGESLFVEGNEIESVLGQVIEVKKLGATKNNLKSVPVTPFFFGQ
ncbi:hypothetical protein [Candidatus Nitrosacidococcus tergens]|uniref:Uncharacterized protein n=1 Tax=Candidatus Nitrosacidococcus tergens TaxID=553981 RepID=A0A7G1Q7T9_9GAMM|nr:hypothetical protein [Candidatus Nitrosacidococcus tergens]CAB1274746.1 exported protein of unknown function [Candidatus Nitrosacidococcus tergens]